MLDVQPVIAPATEPRQRGWFYRAVPLVAIAIIAGAWALMHFRSTGQLPFLHRESVWSIAMYEGISPFELQPMDANNRPVLTAADVTDVPALFVADPFMIQDDGKWLMFVEVLNSATHQGDIGVATSEDGLEWKYDRIVLDESTHLSYPSIHRVDDKWYMLPQADDGVHFYEATAFPYEWQKVHTVLSGDHFADPTLFQYEDLWWMFVARSGTHDELRLYYASNVFGEWTEHPASPIVTNNADIARPGGHVMWLNGNPVRLTQDCAPRYGNQLLGFEITTLTPTDYAERPLDTGPILTNGSHTWNSTGMHHSDAHQMKDGSWRAVVDGHTKRWILQATP